MKYEIIKIISNEFSMKENNHADKVEKVLSDDHHLFNFCHRLYIDREYDGEIGRHIIIKIACNDTTFDEGTIVEKGHDILGFYVVILYSHLFHGSLILGKADFEVVLKPEFVIGAIELIDRENGWFDFHDSEMEILSENLGSITLRFKDGYLFNDIVDIELNSQTGFKLINDSLKNYEGNCITGVHFRKYDEKLECYLFSGENFIKLECDKIKISLLKNDK